MPLRRTWILILCQGSHYANQLRPLLVGAGATARETTAVDPAPTQLKIVLDDALRRTIADAERQFATLRSRTRVSALHFQEFGAVEIKRWGIGSPESVMQSMRLLLQSHPGMYLG